MSGSARDQLRPSRHVPLEIRRALIAEAGEKCANPGCSETLVEFHHIKEWHVYQTHDPQQMIALCPTCHSCVDRGELRLDDELLRAWKRSKRTPSYGRAHIYSEPDALHVLILGPLGLTSSGRGLHVMRSSESHLSYYLANGDSLCLTARIVLGGECLAEIEDGHVNVTPRVDTTFSSRPGRVLLQLHRRPRVVLPTCLADTLRTADPFAYYQRMTTVLDIEVLAPGRIRVQGVWEDTDGDVVVSTRHALLFYSVRENFVINNVATPARGNDDAPAKLLQENPAEVVFDVFKRICLKKGATVPREGNGLFRRATVTVGPKQSRGS